MARVKKKPLSYHWLGIPPGKRRILTTELLEEAALLLSLGRSLPTVARELGVRKHQLAQALWSKGYSNTIRPFYNNTGGSMTQLPHMVLARNAMYRLRALHSKYAPKHVPFTVTLGAALQHALNYPLPTLMESWMKEYKRKGGKEWYSYLDVWQWPWGSRESTMPLWRTAPYKRNVKPYYSSRHHMIHKYREIKNEELPDPSRGTGPALERQAGETEDLE